MANGDIMFEVMKLRKWKEVMKMLHGHKRECHVEVSSSGATVSINFKFYPILS